MKKARVVWAVDLGFGLEPPVGIETTTYSLRDSAEASFPSAG